MIKINNWEELARVPPSKTHRLEITPEDGNGWVVPIGEKTCEGTYLSTHTFYGSMYEYSSKKLQQYGFDIEIANWEETE